MNDNDWRNAMIEEAAKAINTSSSHYGPEWSDIEDRQKDRFRHIARAALAVFEKALGEATVTPTGAQCRILPLQHRVQNPSHHGSAAQGEPSDVQLDAAMVAFYGWVDASVAHPFRENMRAALRAAMSLREGGVR